MHILQHVLLVTLQCSESRARDLAVSKKLIIATVPPSGCTATAATSVRATLATILCSCHWGPAVKRRHGHPRVATIATHRHWKPRLPTSCSLPPDHCQPRRSLLAPADVPSHCKPRLRPSSFRHPCHPSSRKRPLPSSCCHERLLPSSCVSCECQPRLRASSPHPACECEPCCHSCHPSCLC